MVLDGPARKISLILTVFSVLGWLTFDVGFGLRIHNFNSSEADVDPTHRDFFPYWAFMVTALLLYVVYFIHLFMNHGVTQCFTIILMVPYFIGAGGVLYMNGLFAATAVEMLSERYGDSVASDFYWIPVEFAGCLVSVLFYWISLMLWPCFQKNKYRGYYEY